MQAYAATLYLGTTKIGQIAAGTMQGLDMQAGIVSTAYQGTFAAYWVRAVREALAGATEGTPTPLPLARVCPSAPGVPERTGELVELTADRAVVRVHLRRDVEL